MCIRDSFYGLGDAAPAENELGNLIREGIAVNSTAFLDYADPEHIRACLLYTSRCV